MTPDLRGNLTPEFWTSEYDVTAGAGHTAKYC